MIIRGPEGSTTLDRLKKLNRQDYILCKDERNAYAIIQLLGPSKDSIRGHYINVVKQDKIRYEKAIIKARVHGRMLPSHSDLFSTSHYRYRIIDERNVDSKRPLKIYVQVG